MKNTVKLLALVCALAMCIGMLACAFAEGETRQAGLPENPQVSWEKTAEANEANAPKVKEMENGVKVQKTPFNTAATDTQQGEYQKKLVSSWNNIYLDADNRGCTACHTIEDAIEMMDTFHGVIYMGYETEQGLQNCFGCHSFYGDTKLRDSIHTAHQKSNAFAEMGGNCLSCHYIDDEGNYQRWDYVKYDVLRGIADVAADNMDLGFEWNQTELTAHEDMYFKSMKSDPSTWITDDSQTDEEAFNNWTIEFAGDIDNPCTMTLGEMIEKYGTEKRIMKSHCTVNGPGQAMIYQAEVEGIPLSKVLEDLGVHEDCNMFDPIGADGYCYNISLQTMLDKGGLLVIGMNGDRIYGDQGWPVAFWCNEMSAGNFTKQVAKCNIYVSDSASWDFYGDFTDATTGEQYDKPDCAVLTATDGQIFPAGEAIHLEGYADAWNEPIVKLEFSFDHGATWKEYPIEGADTQRWVYWKMDINNELEPGSYLMRIRATSATAEGGERENFYLTNFMFNVQ